MKLHTALKTPKAHINKTVKLNAQEAECILMVFYLAAQPLNSTVEAFFRSASHPHMPHLCA